MTVESVLRAHSFWERLRAPWTRFSTTLFGDIIATAIAIAGVSVLFLASAFAVVWLTELGKFVMHLAGG